MPSKFSLVVLSSVCYWADRAGQSDNREYPQHFLKG